MKAFSWLHLSDLHYGLTGQPPLWPNVRQVFFDDLSRLYERSGPWNAVLFTGDLAQQGNDEEFQGFEDNILGPLWDKLRELGSKDAVLLTVPGNHDMLRPESKKPSAALRQLLRSGAFHEIADEFWGDPACEYRQVVAKAFTNYLQWRDNSPYCSNVPLNTGLLPGDFSVTLEMPLASPGAIPLRIGIVGINTAFLQLTGGDYVGRLLWDLRQVHSACSNDLPHWVKQHAVCLLLTHHGPGWLDDPSRNDVYPEINPAGRFAVHLFGHMHETAIRSTSQGGGRPLRQWQGPSLFGMEKFGDPPSIDRRHGYGVGRIEFADDTATIRYWPRHAIKDSNGWRFERDTENCLLDERDGGTHAESVAMSVYQNLPAPRLPFDDVRATTSIPLQRAVSQIGSAALDDGDALRWQWPHDEPGFREYCEAVCKAHSHIRFVEIPYLKDVSDVELDNLYVEPRFSSHEIHPDTPPSRWPRSLQPVETLRQHPSLVLLGDPGSGKSTLVSCLSWQLCRPGPAPENVWAKHFAGSIPLPMILRELRLKADVTWETLLDAFLEHRIGRLLHTRKAAETLLKDGRAIVLLDGLDEIGNLTVRRKLRDAVHAGMTAYPTSRWLLTSRIVGYEQVPFHTKIENVSAKSVTRAEVLRQTKRTKRVRTLMADVFYLAPFNDQQIRSFAVNWYSQHEKDKAVVQPSAQGFVEAIRENEGTQRLGRIPYLLTLMALIHHKNARLPHGRTELYERIATAYLESIDLRRQLDQLPYSLAQKKRWLAVVAYRMQLRRSHKGPLSTQGDILVGKAEVQRWLRAAMGESGTKDSKGESEILLTYFAQRSGLLLPRAEGKFSFMHLSLQEYFAACFLEPRLTASRFSRKKQKIEPSDDQLRTWANSEIWTETFVLLFELLSEKSIGETESLLAYLFQGRLKNDQSGNEASAAGLLSELATDPFVLLSAETRRKIRQQCWRWLFAPRAVQRRGRFPDLTGNKIVRSLIRESDGDLRKAWMAASIGPGELRRVTTLDLSDCPTLADLSPLVALRRLRHLDLQGCTAVSDLGPLGKLPELAVLILGGCGNVVSLEPLRGAKNLQRIMLGALCDLRPLAELRLLSDLHLHYTSDGHIDLSPIAQLPHLARVCVPGDVRVATDLGRDKREIASPGIRRLLKELRSGAQRPGRRYRARMLGRGPLTISNV